MEPVYSPLHLATFCQNTHRHKTLYHSTNFRFNEKLQIFRFVLSGSGYNVKIKPFV